MQPGGKYEDIFECLDGERKICKLSYPDDDWKIENCNWIAFYRCHKYFPDMASNSNWETPELPEDIPYPHGNKAFDAFPKDAIIVEE